MGLENLKSIFEEDLNNSIEDFSSNVITDVNGTNFFNTPPRPTIHIATNPTDFSTAVGNNDLPFTPLSQLGERFLDGLSWEKLYNADHSPLSNAGHKGLVPISYPNVSRDNLKMGKRAGNIQRYGFERGDEPYVISPIGDEGREKNKGGRSIPITRALTDTDRILNFITSPQGLSFALQQNINIPIQNTVVNKNGSLIRTPQRFGVTYNPLSTLAVQASRILGQSIPNILIRKSGFDLGADILGGIGSAVGGQVGETLNTVADLLSPTEYKHSPANLINNSGLPYFSINDTFTAGITNTTEDGFASTLVDKLSDAASNLLSGETPVTPVSAGDKMTLSKIAKGNEILSAGLASLVVDENFSVMETLPNIDAEADGIPFYFKDLRDNSYIFFRAYIEGLTENISPSYASHNYIGRSEPVWTYERAEREISMTLKLVAQTQGELVRIYEKMDRLTSMCYPEYQDDDYGSRMKPPLAKLRYGELYGKTNKELLGYIKSVSYSVENSSTYETDPEVGRVPRHVTATIGYQVIHDKVPGLGKTTFYGINQ
tara:strand:- start:307 stop:1941 length:1635 start_codon:yes stop_codon:yes gene_type:complete